MQSELKTICQKAGKLAQTLRSQGLQAFQKQGVDYCTQADRNCEDLLTKELAPLFPDYALIGEEGCTDFQQELPKRYLAIDPIDGTWNFANGLKDWGCLISLVDDYEPKVAAMYMPDKDLFFFAEKGKGTFRNGTPLKMDRAFSSLDTSLINLDVYHRYDQEKIQTYYQPLIDKSLGCRSVLATIAATEELLAGHTAAYLNPCGAKVWDLSAPSLLVEEAGGCTFSYRPDGKRWRYLPSGELFTANPQVMAWIKDLGICKTQSI